LQEFGDEVSRSRGGQSDLAKTCISKLHKIENTKVLERALYDSAAVFCRKMARKKYF
jgi:hypothetical protein